ncbi:MAG: hypothetical protein ACRDTD_23030 [Pseudonocardiaceae bacterium]
MAGRERGPVAPPPGGRDIGQVDQTLALDAVARLDREIERHRCTSQHIEKLLTDLNDPFEEYVDAQQRGGPKGSMSVNARTVCPWMIT